MPNNCTIFLIEWDSPPLTLNQRMRASFENISAKKGAQAFYAYEISMPRFEFNWHYHPEYELTLITRGSGKRLIGDSHKSFGTGDLVLIGPGLPHTWITGSANRSDRQQKAIVIQFSYALLENWLGFAEFRPIRDMLHKSARGLSFSRSLAVESLLRSLPDKRGLGKVVAFLHVLKKLSECNGVVLSSAAFTKPAGSDTERRINAVYNYVQDNFHRSVQLNDVARRVHLSPSAFCKFIRKVLNTTFSDYVNEVRIAHACKLLTETDRAVQQIASDCGFESITYFNRTFLKKKGIRPSNFRKK